MIVVQSLDGKLQIFEQTANAFTRQFVDCLYVCVCIYICVCECLAHMSLAMSYSH